VVRRLRTDQQDKLRVAVLAVDLTRRRGGGALLGDRIRMNALDGEHVFFRSLATRGGRELPGGIEDIITACKAAGFDLVILETPGIGQGDGIKAALFAELNGVVKRPDAILATNTSSILVVEVAQATTRPGQVVGLHFFNPAPVQKLVEVIPSVRTHQDGHPHSRFAATRGLTRMESAPRAHRTTRSGLSGRRDDQGSAEERGAVGGI
jgi:hypothetical protein